MKRISLLIIVLTSLIVLKAQSIEISYGNNTEKFKVSEIDSITHEIQNAEIKRLVWHNGSVVSEKPVSVGDSIRYVKPEPTLVGVWDAVETYSYRPFPGAAWEDRTRTYTIEFKDDGTFTKSDTSFVSSTWSYSSSSGSFSAKGNSIATTWQVSWDRFTGNADDKEYPMKLTGKRYEGNFNAVTTVEDAKGEFIMTRR